MEFVNWKKGLDEMLSCKLKHNGAVHMITKHWVVGLYEAIIAVEEISKLKLEQNNRICLLILDSTLEIAFKEYLLYESGTYYSPNAIKNFDRVSLQNKVKTHCHFKNGIWTIIDSYYIKRCDLVHSRATTQISNQELKNYREVAEYALKKMFRINFDRS